MKLNVIIIICLMFSCSSKKFNNEKVLALQQKVLEGDTASYELLSSYYFKINYDSLLPYSKIMADKYEYKRAFYDVFEIIYVSNSVDCYDYNLSCLDNKEMEVALNYFTKAVEKGDVTASNVLLTCYDKNKSYPIPVLYENLELIKIAKSNIEEN